MAASSPTGAGWPASAASDGSSRRTSSGSASPSRTQTSRARPTRAAREEIVEAEHADFFDHADVEAILGSGLKAKSYAPGEWLGFNPDFVYRHRPVKPAVSTARLAQALASMTSRVDDFADKAGYDS